MDYLKGLEATVANALAEDVRDGDITAQLIAKDTRASATVITRQHAIVCGRPWVDEVIRQVDPAMTISWKVDDGDEVSKNDVLLTLEGKARSLLTAERSALNFLQLLSGTATATDLEKLGEEVRKRVYANSGLTLEWEVIRVGEPAI